MKRIRLSHYFSLTTALLLTIAVFAFALLVRFIAKLDLVYDLQLTLFLLSSVILIALSLFFILFMRDAHSVIHKQKNALIAANNQLELRVQERTEALVKKEQLLDTVLNEIPSPVVLKDHKGDFLLGNQAVATLYNTIPEAMVGKHDGDFGVPKEMADFFRQNVLSIMEKGETEVVLEDSMDAATGEIRHFKSIKKPFKNNIGENQILVIATEITDIVRAQRLVKESEKRLSFVLEAIGEGVWDWHIPERNVVHNAYWCQMLSVNDALLEHSIDFFASLLYEEDRERVMMAINTAMKHDIFYTSEHRMLKADGSLIWVNDRGRVVERNAQGEPLRMVGSIRDITEFKSSQAQIQYLADYDVLTGLCNRSMLEKRLAKLLVTAINQRPLAILFIDLDRFKTINDSLGYHVGDQLLVEVTNRIRALVRVQDIVARFGGDEFVVVQTEMVSEIESVQLAEKIIAALSEIYSIENHQIYTSTSIGISLYPNDAVGADDLLKAADTAMYVAKKLGGNNAQFFASSMNEVANERLLLERDLHHALDRQQLELYYQPQVNAHDQTLVGVEALLRWHHPERGLVSPLTFIPIAEDSGQIIQIGYWVLEEACRQRAAWREAGMENISIAVNLSAHQLRSSTLVSHVQQLLEQYQLKSGDLEIEITESTVMVDPQQAIERLNALRKLGVHLSIDDFGTGYSSLAYLKLLPINMLKLDRAFVKDLEVDENDAAICKATIALAHNLGLQVVAEGVENEAQSTFLRQLNCDYFQGYLFGKPEPALDWIKRWQEHHG